MSLNVNTLDQVVYVITNEDNVVYVTTVPNNIGQASIQFQDEGVNLGTAGTVNQIDFVGSGIQAQRTGSKITVTASGGGGTGAVDSFNGRTGAVTPEQSDYDNFFLTPSEGNAAYVPLSRTVNGQVLSSNIVIPTSLHYTRTGNYFINSITANTLTTVQLGANSLRAFPFIVPKSITFTEIVSEVTTNVSSTNYRLALYTDNGNSYPDAKVSGTEFEYDSGVSTGVKSSGAVNITISPGLYWVVFNANGAPTLRAIPVSNMPQVFGASSFLTTSPLFTRWTVSAVSYGVLPSTFTAGGSATVNSPSPLVGLLL